MEPGERGRAAILREVVGGFGQEQPVLTPKHHKMAGAPFLFMRGTAPLFYRDLAAGTLHLPKPFHAKVLQTSILADCHLANFGFVTEKGSHGGHIVFVPTDFDDALIGPAAWDLVRLLSSVWLAHDQAEGLIEGRYSAGDVELEEGMRAASGEECENACAAFLTRYRETCAAIAQDPSVRGHVLDDFEKGNVLRKLHKKAAKRAIGGKNFEEKSSLGKAVLVDPGGLRFRERPGRYRRLDAARQSRIRAMFRPYVDDDILDIVERLGQGTGSVNLTRYYLLVGPEGASTHAELPMCHVVEIKKQRSSAALESFPDLDPRNDLSPAHLTVTMQRRIQREPDLLLEDVAWEDGDWLVRSRHHARVGIKPERLFLGDGDVGKNIVDLCEACGSALALAHSRGDYRTGRFEHAMSSAVAESSEALLETASAYAERAIRDWSIFKAMVDEDVRQGSES